MMTFLIRGLIGLLIAILAAGIWLLSVHIKLKNLKASLQDSENHLLHLLNEKASQLGIEDFAAARPPENGRFDAVYFKKLREELEDLSKSAQTEDAEKAHAVSLTEDRLYRQQMLHDFEVKRHNRLVTSFPTNFAASLFRHSRLAYIDDEYEKLMQTKPRRKTRYR